MTKRFEYTDIDGIIKEAEAFIASEFVTTSAPNSPVKTLPSGYLDSSLIPPVAQAEATKVAVERIAHGDILSGDLVRAFSPNYVTLADPTTDADSANVLGVAITDALDGNTVKILVFGIVTNPIFNVFAVNDILFLDDLGAITNVKPTLPSSKYQTSIGKSLGGTEIFVNIMPPIKLG